MDYAKLADAVERDAALRRKQILQPVGGKNDKIFRRHIQRNGVDRDRGTSSSGGA